MQVDMKIRDQSDASMGVVVEDFDATAADPSDIDELKRAVYDRKIAVLKDQRLTPAEFVALGKSFGEVERYYEPMYWHPQEPDIFVSSNVKKDDATMGVPRTGSFWHADYIMMPRPFALTLVYPQVVPKVNRGTYFIDMGRAHERLSERQKAAVAGTSALHDPLRHVKIRPEDVYKPVGQVLDEIRGSTPPISHPTVFTHPATGESVLYVSRAVTTAIQDGDGIRPDDLLRDLLETSGQLDDSFRHEGIHLQTFEEGDLLIWDNRSLMHRALHTPKPEPTVSFRVTVHDEYEYFGAPR